MISHERRHQKQVEANKNQPKISSFATVILTPNENKELYCAGAVCVAMDNSTLSFTGDKGIDHYVSVITKICHKKKGRVPAGDIFSSNKTSGKYVNYWLLFINT